jgi:hypothetical protein
MIIYVIKCESGKYYVGKTKNEYSLANRVRAHLDGYGAFFTKKFKPLKNNPIEKIEVNSNIGLDVNFLEDAKVKEYMKKYGIDNVRGGSFSTINLSKEDKRYLEKEIFGASDLCFKCGAGYHWSNKCPIKKKRKNSDSDEEIIEFAIEKSKEVFSYFKKLFS